MEMTLKFMIYLIILLAIIISTIALLITAKKISNDEREMLKEATSPKKYYKGLLVEYHWMDSRGRTIKEKGKIEKVQSDYLIIKKDKNFSRVVSKDKIIDYELISENVQDILI